MTTLQWLPQHGALFYLGLAAALAALVALARWSATSPVARSWVLLLLRATVIGLLVLLLLNPVKVTETRLPDRTPEMVYLVDCSRSMALDRPRSRLDQVKQVLAASGQAASAGGPVRISQYRFGRKMAAASSTNELRADDDGTLLLGALERVPSRWSGRPLGVVVFSDGRTEETAGLEEIAAGYRQLGVPIHVFPVGDARVAGDVAIQELVVPRNPPPGARVPVRVQLAGHGFQGQRVEIAVRPAADPQAKPLAALPVTLAEGPQSHELVLEADAARGDLAIEVPVLPGEAIAENNRVPFQIASQKKKLRVIYMEATMGEEYRFLQDALVEDPNLECLSIVVDYQYTRPQRLYRVGDRARSYPATREELFGYDVVICSDIDRSAFTPDQLQWTAELVADRGGGFAMVGGLTSFGMGQWDQTIWDKLIPADMSGGAFASNNGFVTMDFRVAVPAEVAGHPIWRIVPDPEKNRQVLAAMPFFHGTNLIERLKPGATNLGLTDRPLPRVGTMPVFACQSYGKGRTFAMTTDTTVDWGRDFETRWGEGDNRYFRKFWRNVVTWLGENSSGNRRLRIDTDKIIYRPGEPIQVTVRAYDEKLEETSRYRMLARVRPPGAAVRSSAAPPRPPLAEAVLAAGGEDRTYRGSLAAPSPAALPAAGNAPSMRPVVLEVAAYDQDRAVAEASLDLQVLDDCREFREPQPDPERLSKLAASTGGQVLRNAGDLNRLLLDRQAAPGELVVQRAPAWDRPWLWFGLLAALSVEWIVRRRRGLA